MNSACVYTSASEDAFSKQLHVYYTSALLYVLAIVPIAWLCASVLMSTVIGQRLPKAGLLLQQSQHPLQPKGKEIT